LGPSIDQDGAGATLALSTTVLGSGQIKISRNTVRRLI